MTTARDLFDSSTDAHGDDVPVSARRQWVEPKPCELVGKLKKDKKADLNPQEKRYLEAHGYTYARVDKANPFGGVSVDLFGIADFLAFRPGTIALIQLTTDDNAATRQRKCESKTIAKNADKSPRDYLKAWLAAGGIFYVHGWRQPGGPGTRWELVSRRLVRMDDDGVEWVREG